MNTFPPDQYPETLFADLLLPVPIPKLFTYRIPIHFNSLVQPGQRVIIQFGDRKIITGIIMKLHHEPPKEYEAKYILEVLEDYAVLKDTQLKFFQWMADYYVCTVGEVLNAALPSGLKLSSSLSLAKGSTSIHVPFFFFNVCSTYLAAAEGFPMSWKESKNVTKS